MKRRNFLKNSTIGTAAMLSTPMLAAAAVPEEASPAVAHAKKKNSTHRDLYLGFPQCFGKGMVGLKGWWERFGRRGTGCYDRGGRCRKPDRGPRWKAGPGRQCNAGCLHYGQGWQLWGRALSPKYRTSRFGGPKSDGIYPPCDVGRKGCGTVCL